MFYTLPANGGYQMQEQGKELKLYFYTYVYYTFAYELAYKLCGRGDAAFLEERGL